MPAADAPLSPSTFLKTHNIKGFLAEDEGERLSELAASVSEIGPCLEIGSYCGKSTVYLGAACGAKGNTLYAVDHHQGSEEHQLGEEYHDADLFDSANHCMNSFPAFRQTIRLAGLDHCVVPIVASSALVLQKWQTPLGMVFIDGGHSHESAMADCVGWAKHIASGGILAVHDIFPSPEDGGQGPYLGFEKVFESGLFEKLAQVNSLGILRKK